MRPKVYKVKEEYDDVDMIIEYLLEEAQFTQNTNPIIDTDKKIKMTLFTDLHSKKTPERIAEIEEFFEITPRFSEASKQYNTIILVETSQNYYLLPEGYAFHTVEKIAKSDFGLSFAERTVQEEGISLRGVSYIQRNKIREVTQYKEDQNDFSRASESYFSISGKPRDENIFGSTIDCGTAISFSKNFDVNTEFGRNEFFQLFNEIDVAMNNEILSSFPRYMILKKTDPIINQLKEKLLETLKSDEPIMNISTGFNRIQIAGNKIEIIDTISTLQVYINNKSDNKAQIGFNGENLQEFIRENTVEIKSIDDLKLVVNNADDIAIKRKSLLEFLFCEIELEINGINKVYILDNGRWGHFNSRFDSLVEDKMNEINHNIEISDFYSIEYPIIKDNLQGEDAFIENLLNQNEGFYKLHKRLIPTGGSSIEIADIYDSETDTLITIKRGIKTSTSMYSFDQSILGSRILSNHEEFDIIKYLSDYRDSNHPLPNPIIKKIINCRNQQVLWLVSNKPDYVYKAILENDFHINNLKSFLLKLKIIDWYSYLVENSFNIKLSFSLDLPATQSSLNIKSINAEEPVEV